MLNPMILLAHIEQIDKSVFTNNRVIEVVDTAEESP